jgi:predicted transposase YbfD/YdcC
MGMLVKKEQGMDEQPAAISIHFAQLEDPRTAHLVDHKLIDIIMIAICAVISGAETWTDIALFGQEREAWLR